MSRVVSAADTEASSSVHVLAQDALNHRITDASGNPTLANIYKITLDRTHLIRRVDIQATHRPEQSADALRGLGQLLRAGEMKSLIQMVRAIVEDRRTRLPTLVEQANANAAKSMFPWQE